ncbi:MAG: RNA pyrophosphohydrolase [Pseudomonadota bacterium]
MTPVARPPGTPDLPYRPCVGLMLINPHGLVFAGRRLSDSLGEAWQMPQGGIDKNETPRKAALRELKEEVGTDKVTILAETTDWLSYDLPAPLLGKALGGRFCGQKQKWFALRFEGTDDDIDIATEEPEFDRWSWLEPEEVCRRIVDFKRPIYDAVFEEFSPFVAGAAR